MKREIKNINSTDCEKDDEDENINQDQNSSVYFDVLKQFIKGLLDGKYNDVFIPLIKSAVINHGNLFSFVMCDEDDFNV